MSEGGGLLNRYANYTLFFEPIIAFVIDNAGGYGLPSTKNQPKTYTMIKLKNVAQEYLRSFPLIKNEDTPEESKSDKNKREYEKIKRVKSGKLSIDDIERLEEREKADIVFNKILNKSAQLSKTLNKRDEPVLDDYTWQDLNLIAGNTTTPDKNVLNYIK